MTKNVIFMQRMIFSLLLFFSWNINSTSETQIELAEIRIELFTQQRQEVKSNISIYPTDDIYYEHIIPFLKPKEWLKYYQIFGPEIDLTKFLPREKKLQHVLNFENFPVVLYSFDNFTDLKFLVWVNSNKFKKIENFSTLWESITRHTCYKNIPFDMNSGIKLGLIQNHLVCLEEFENQNTSEIQTLNSMKALVGTCQRHFIFFLKKQEEEDQIFLTCKGIGFTKNENSIALQSQSVFRCDRPDITEILIPNDFQDILQKKAMAKNCFCKILYQYLKFVSKYHQKLFYIPEKLWLYANIIESCPKALGFILLIFTYQIFVGLPFAFLPLYVESSPIWIPIIATQNDEVMSIPIFLLWSMIPVLFMPPHVHFFTFMKSKFEPKSELWLFSTMKAIKNSQDFTYTHRNCRDPGQIMCNFVWYWFFLNLIILMHLNIFISIFDLNLKTNFFLIRQE